MEQIISPERPVEKPLLIDGPTVDFLLDTSPTTRWRLVKKGKLKPVKIGRNTKYGLADAEALVEELGS